MSISGLDSLESRTTAAMAAGASYLSGIDLEMSNFGLNSLKSRTPAVFSSREIIIDGPPCTN